MQNQDIDIQILGCSEEQAITILKQKEMSIRIVERDNEKFLMTADYIPNRINLIVRNGIVEMLFFG